MLAFIQTASKVYVAETVAIAIEGVEAYFWRVGLEQTNGETRVTGWRQGTLSGIGTLESVARKLKGTLYLVGE